MRDSCRNYQWNVGVLPAFGTIENEAIDSDIALDYQSAQKNTALVLE